MADPVPTQFDLPFRISADGTTFVEIEQDSVDETKNNVETLFRTELGTIESDPDFGITDPTFDEAVPDLNEAQTAISLYVPLADALLDSEPDLLDEFVSRVNTKVRDRNPDA